MLLYIIRHGDPNYERDCLTERGRLQAAALAKRLQASGIGSIYSSPLGRAVETAAATAELLGLETHIEPWAEEVHEERLTPFPDGIMKSVSVVQNSYFRENGAIDLPYDRGFDAPGFRESGMKTASERIVTGGRDFLERLGYREEGGVYRILRPSEEKVALFCHTVMGRTWLSSLLHIPIHMMWADFQMTHTGVTVLEFRNRENGVTAPRCLCFSDMSHLYAAGLDMYHDNRIEL